MDIDIFSIIGKNGKFCAKFLRKNMLSLSSSQNNLHFKAIMSIQDPPSGWEVQEYMPKFEHTSLNHTMGINRTKQYVTSPYMLISDADMVVLCRDWDVKLIDHMKKHKINVLGVGYWKNEFGYRGFPIVTFFITTREAFLKANVDFRPNLQLYPNRLGVGCTNLKISEEQGKIIHRPRGFLLRQDSGWRFPFSYHKHGYTGAVLKKEPNALSIISEASQMWNLNGEPILCHLGKSTKRGMSRVTKWYNSIRKYLNA